MSFWMVMRYGCTRFDLRRRAAPTTAAHGIAGCGFVLQFYLEDGCEGPKNGTPIPSRLAADHPFTPNAPIEIPTTASGRIVVPVPFVAGRCPSCHQGDLTHIEWHLDHELNPAIDEPPTRTGRFRYPSRSDFKRYGSQACGRPIYERNYGGKS